VALAFDQHHPTALAVYCSDGRFTRAVEYLLRSLGHDRLDTLTFPGGPAMFRSGPADLSEVFVFSRATRFLIEAHKITHAVLLAHENCGFYRARLGRQDDERIKRVQIEHLHAAGKALAQQHPGLQVTCYYARIEQGKVAFDEVWRAAGPDETAPAQADASS
jgi:hypothetical protein